MSINQSLLSEFDHEMKVTRKLLERVPLENAAWKPHARSMSLGRLAGHVAELPSFGAGMLGADVMDMDKGEYKPANPSTREELLAAFDASAAGARDALASASDQHLLSNWSLVYKGNKLFHGPRVAAWRTMAMNHLIHHRGQLSVYLRLNEVPVPGIYGPSADES